MVYIYSLACEYKKVMHIRILLFYTLVGFVLDVRACNITLAQIEQKLEILKQTLKSLEEKQSQLESHLEYGGKNYQTFSNSK